MNASRSCFLDPPDDNIFSFETSDMFFSSDFRVFLLAIEVIIVDPVSESLGSSIFLFVMELLMDIPSDAITFLFLVGREILSELSFTSATATLSSVFSPSPSIVLVQHKVSLHKC